MFPPQSGPAELRGSQWSVCPAASNTPGLHIYGLYMDNNYFYICCVDNNLHAALCRPVDCQCVQHGSDVWLHDFSLIGSFIKYSVPAAGGQHHHFCEERAEEDPEGSESRLPRMLRESEEQQQRGICEDHSGLPEENEAGGAG